MCGCVHMCNKFVILYISTDTLAALPHNTKLRIYGWMFLSASSFLRDQCFCATPTFKWLVIPVMVLKCNIYCMKNIKLGFTWHLVTRDGCMAYRHTHFYDRSIELRDRCFCATPTFKWLVIVVMVLKCCVK